MVKNLFVTDERFPVTNCHKCMKKNLILMKSSFEKSVEAAAVSTTQGKSLASLHDNAVFAS
jgi:hypothetical protein